MQHFGRRDFLALAAGALAASSLPGCRATPSRPPARPWRSLQALLDGYIARRQFAGVLAAIAYYHEALTYLTAGTVALESRVPVDEHSLWRIYSMTKPITGFASMLLIEDGRLALDQPVADVLPEFRSLRVRLSPQTLESRPAVGVMTMRHLLTHTSGLDYWIHETANDALPLAHRQRGITPGDYGYGVGGPYVGYGPQARGLPEMISRLAQLPLAYDPGATWHYSVGLDVMGAVIERVTGQGLDVFMRERLFDPLGMRSTGFQVSRKDAARLTTNYLVTKDGLKPLDAGATSAWLDPPILLSGGAGLVTSARDLVRFGAMLLDEGALDGVRVADVATVRLALSNLLPEGVPYAGGGFGAGAQRALPGNTSEPPLLTGTYVWGGAAGTMWWIDPARRANFVFMTQHMPYGSYPILEEVSEAIAADLAAPGQIARRSLRSSHGLSGSPGTDSVRAVAPDR